jgi:iron-sulfur cluster assembly protein
MIVRKIQAQYCQFKDGALLWIDSKAQLTLIGSEMDFIHSKLAAEFVFHNPNIESTCGCGESFNMKKPPSLISPESSRLESPHQSAEQKK